MRKPRKLATPEVGLISAYLNETKSAAEFKRVQCVWLSGTLGLTAKQVATAIGWHPRSVKRIQSRYRREGTAAFQGSGKGGRYRQNLTLEEEQQLIDQFRSKAEQGGMLVVSEIKAAYEQKIGRQVPKSTIYRMLKRHGWRKVAPRPRHPKADPALQEEFKKTSR